MATPNLTTEVTAFPAYPRVNKISYSARRIFFEDGSSVSYEDTTYRFREWTLVYENQSDAEWESFRTFFEARRGQNSTFYWNDLRVAENDIKVCFLDEHVERSIDGARASNWRVRIREVTA